MKTITKKLEAVEEKWLREATLPEITERLKKEFPDIFKAALEKGDKMVGEEATLEMLSEEEIKEAGIKPEPATTAIPVKKQWYQRAFQLLQEELASGQIERVDKNTSFCSKSFFIPKLDNIRLRRVTDFRNVNKFLKRPATPFTPSEQVRQNLDPNSKVYCTMDLVSGYHQVPLCEKDRDLTTFITPWGRFRYTCLPMGLSPSGDIFNIRTAQMIEGIPGVHKSIDDVLVEAKSKKEMYVKLFQIFSNCRRDGIILHPDKFKLGTRVKFGGFVLDCTDQSVGPKILPDMDKVNRLVNYSPPKNKTQVRQFIGLLKQLNNWSSKLTKLSNNFKRLENANSRFVWNDDHQKEFDNLKKEISHLGFLSPFDVNKQQGHVYCC